MDQETAETTRDTIGPTADALFSVTNVDYICRRCNTSFPSNNKLHKHLHDCLKHDHPTKAPQSLPKTTQEKHTIIKSTATHDSAPAFSFRSWHYAVVQAGLTPENMTAEFCVDTGCNMSLIDRDFLKRLLPNCRITQYEQPIPVRGIGERIHHCSEYATFDLYISGSIHGQPAVTQISRGARIVEGLQANMLIGMDIIGPEGMSMVTPKWELHVSSCNNLIAPISITPRAARIQRVVCAKEETKIPPSSAAAIPIKLRGKGTLPKGRNFLFDPAKPSA